MSLRDLGQKGAWRIARGVDLDAGFVEGRQFGRGESGGQWRDDFREDVDEGRGGQGGMSATCDFIQEVVAF